MKNEKRTMKNEKRKRGYLRLHLTLLIVLCSLFFCLSCSFGGDTESLRPGGPHDNDPKKGTVSICTVNNTGSFWLNGEKKGELARPAWTSLDNLNFRITTSGGKVYILGSFDNNEIRTFCYWVNGVRTDFNIPSGFNDFRQFMVSDGKVFISCLYYYGYHVEDDDYFGRFNSRQSCYWLDGVRTDLSLPNGNSIYEYLEPTVSNGRVYIAGAYFPDQDDAAYYEDPKPKACYWVDGIRTDLSVPSGNDFSQAYNITVSNGKVYVSGAYGNYHVLEHEYSTYRYRTQKACYWVDGVRTDLKIPDGLEYSTGSNITISDGKVYIAGAYGNHDRLYREYDMPSSFPDSNLKPCYWVNGEKTDLSYPAGTENSWADLPTVSGDKVYTFGHFLNADHLRTFGYWVNGTRTDLTPKNSYEDDSFWPIWPHLIVSDGRVYVAGHSYERGAWENQEACYWVDGVRTNLDVPDWVGVFYSSRFAVSGGKVHIVAGDIERGYDYWDDDNPYERAFYWIDGVKQTLPDANNIVAIALVAE
jgi:hypothetical protein